MKGKGKIVEKFKPTPKVTNDDQIIQEMQVKKSYLIERLSKLDYIFLYIYISSLHSFIKKTNK